MHRSESPMMRTLRQLDYDAHRLRAVDLIALVLGYGVLLSACVAGAVALADWIGGRPDTVLPALAALMQAFDGGVR